MEFCKNLQNLRKKQNMSQEQLAEKLDVTRQSVSKWESGQTYPEMDKLITICKLFNVDLNDLINGDVFDEKGKVKSKSFFDNFVNDFTKYVKQVSNLLSKKTFKEIVKFCVEIAAIIIVILLCRIPIELLISAGRNVFSFLGNDLGNVIFHIWSFIINIIYLILAVIGFFTIFKYRYLDGEEELDFYQDTDDETNEVKTNNVKSASYKKIEKTTSSFSFVNLLTGIVMFFIKMFLFFIFVPLAFILLGTLVCFALSISYLFQGVVFFGIIIGLFGAVVLLIVLLEFLFNIIFDKKNNLTRVFITFIVSLILLGIGIGITTLDITKLKIIDDAPSNIEITNKTNTVKFNKDMIFTSYCNYFIASDVNFIEDTTLGNNIKFEIAYYDKYVDVNFENNNNKISYIYSSDGIGYEFGELYEMFLNDLKTDYIYNYSKLSEIKVTIYGSKTNIETLSENSLKYCDYVEEQEEYNNYEIERNSLENKITELNEELENLQTENEKLKTKVEDLEESKQELLNQIKDLLN